MKFKIFLLLFGIAMSIPHYANASEITTDQQKRLISNLNYLQYSTARIKMSDNKAIAEDVYYSIINELKIEFINNRDLNFQYGEFLEKCKNLKLTQNEKDFIKQMNEKQQKSAYLSAFSNMGAVFVPGQSPQQMVASLVYTTVANAVAIANQKNQLKLQLEKDYFYLDQKIVSDIFDMQTSLFTTSAKLLAGSDAEGRINENSMNIFMKATKLLSEEKKNALCEQQLQQSLASFPPYWYELGNAYQELGENTEAVKCYDKFMALKSNDIILKDKNYVNLLKNRIHILLGSDASCVMQNAFEHKAEILKYIDLLKVNYLDSESGEKNSYLAKIYYLIGDTNQSLQCLNYIINSKSIYPELIDEAVSLKMLIEASGDGEKAQMYQQAYNFSRVKFGNNDVDYSKLNVKRSWVSRCLNVIWDFIRFKWLWGDDEPQNNQPQIDEDWLCFEIPNSLRKNYVITLDVEDKLYVPIFIDQDNTDSSLGFINIDYDDIDSGVIRMHCKSVDNGQEIVVDYALEEVKTKVYKAADKAYKRMGSDIIAHNAQTAVEYGKIMRKYDYEVDEEQDLAEDIREDKEDWGEDNNKTEDEVKAEISKALSEQLAPDLKYLKERLAAVESAHYKKKEGILYSPEIVSYDGDYYLVGIISVYDSSKGKSFAYDANGDMTFLDDEITEIKNQAILDLQSGAISGSVKSMVNLGIALIEGNNTDKHPQDGIRWLLIATKNIEDSLSEDLKMDIARACKYLGDCYAKGIGVEKDKKQAKKWFEKSRNYGFKIDD